MFLSICNGLFLHILFNTGNLDQILRPAIKLNICTFPLYFAHAHNWPYLGFPLNAYLYLWRVCVQQQSSSACLWEKVKMSSDPPRERIKQLTLEDGNRVCADCGESGKLHTTLYIRAGTYWAIICVRNINLLASVIISFLLSRSRMGIRKPRRVRLHQLRGRAPADEHERFESSFR